MMFLRAQEDTQSCKKKSGLKKRKIMQGRMRGRKDLSTHRGVKQVKDPEGDCREKFMILKGNQNKWQERRQHATLMEIQKSDQTPINIKMQNQWMMPWVYASNISVDQNQSYYYMVPLDFSLQAYQQPIIPIPSQLSPDPVVSNQMDPEPTSSSQRNQINQEASPLIKQQNQEHQPEQAIPIPISQVHPTQEIVSKYAKKNVESNIVNQVFSFLCNRSKSGRLIQKILLYNGAQISKYYELLRAVKKLNKKYINRIYLYNLLELDRSNPIYKVTSKNSYESILPKELLKKCLRIAAIHYLEEVCISTIFTSGKLERITKKEHLKRRQEVLGFLYQQYQNGKKDRNK